MSKEHFNAFNLVGKVVKVGNMTAWIETVGHGTRGKTFVDLHTITLQDKPGMDKIEKLRGKRLSVWGNLADSGDPRLLLAATPTITAVKKTVKDVNAVRITGQVENCELFPAKEGKKQFTSILIECDGSLINGVAFRGLASKLETKAPKGTILTLGGRMRRREFELNEGGTGYAVDIIADPSETKIEAASELVNPFDNMPDWDIPADSGDTEEAPAKEQAAAPSRRNAV